MTTFSSQNNNEEQGAKIILNSPTTLPNASHFLWNKQMVAQINCRGYMTAQFMQPEPAKYSHAPNMEAKTFIQPEQPYYSEHPGRFVFVKDEDTGDLVSAPYEPMKSNLKQFRFVMGQSEVTWTLDVLGVQIMMHLSLTKDYQVELWQVEIINTSGKERNLSIYPYFSIGYMSWMNQSADYDHTLNAIIASSITPYQKVDDYFKNQQLKDKTVLLASTKPTSWTASFSDFVGLEGITNPSSLQQKQLNNKIACYESPVAVMQYKFNLSDKEKKTFRFIFGPAKDKDEIQQLKQLLDPERFELERTNYRNYIEGSQACLQLTSPDKSFDAFVNNWLPRQMYYHGDVNRLSTDPQTRNFIQDAMAMIYIEPETTKQRLMLALSQQKSSGQMPDGILLNKEAELKYINQVPHADHCVWLPICLLAYLEETNDVGFLTEQVPFSDQSQVSDVAHHIELAIEWLLSSTDSRGLSFIEQGDWCDPMNMVGYKGKGVSAWLTIATSYAIKCWLLINKHYVLEPNLSQVDEFEKTKAILDKKINQYFWHNKWFGRGITDDGNLFGIESDSEGKMFLNPQSWAMLADVMSEQQKSVAIRQIYQQLATPFGVTMLAPSYTKMREDIGRVTQKSPGVAENGSVYNHAAVFYAYALFESGFSQQGFDVISRMLPNQDDPSQQGQLANYIPNYYRGAYYQFQSYAGRSSQLFNTGTVAWYYKSVVDGLCGIRGFKSGVRIAPQLPDAWNELKINRQLRGAKLNIQIARKADCQEKRITVNGEVLQNDVLTKVEIGQIYNINVDLPLNMKAKPKLTIVMGVSGTGKTRIADSLSDELNHVFVDADDFHSSEAREKMSASLPLDDADREPWIDRILSHLTMLRNNNQSVVMAYSGLKHRHRNRFRETDYDIKFINLVVEEKHLITRINNRKDHFFSAELLTSQLNAMESFTDMENDVFDISNNGSVEQTVQTIKQELSYE